MLVSPAKSLSARSEATRSSKEVTCNNSAAPFVLLPQVWDAGGVSHVARKSCFGILFARSARSLKPGAAHPESVQVLVWIAPQLAHVTVPCTMLLLWRLGCQNDGAQTLASG